MSLNSRRDLLQSGLRFFWIAGVSFLLGACRPPPQDPDDHIASVLEARNKQIGEAQGMKPAPQQMRDANESFAKGDYFKAKLACERVIASSPDSPAARDAAALLAQVQEKLNQAPNTPDLDLTLNELWNQRFEGNRYRAKQRLDDKLIRVTGAVDDISEKSFSISGARSPIGPVNMTVNLNDAYSNKIQTGLAFLERGTQVTVQGRFSFEKMWLSSAVFVDRATGRVLLSEDMKELSRTNEPSTRPAVK